MKKNVIYIVIIAILAIALTGAMIEVGNLQDDLKNVQDSKEDLEWKLFDTRNHYVMLLTEAQNDYFDMKHQFDDSVDACDELRTQLEVAHNLIANLKEHHEVENSVYVSEEYYEELEYNSKTNEWFDNN